jgi:hypothetical protein
MTQLLTLDVPENTPIVTVGSPIRTHRRPDRPVLPRRGDTRIVIDHRATGCRHAVWYSSVAGLVRSRITQWDKDATRIEPA